MKIRNGFVSNSSSQSFLIRGIRIKKDELAKILGVKEWCDIPIDKPNDLVVEDTRDFFDGEETDDCIVGVDLGDLEDGIVKEIPNADDDSIIHTLAEANIHVDGASNLSTFVQYISNDNC